MAVQGVGDYDNVSRAEAAQKLRDGNVSAEEKAYYVAEFGEDFVKQALSVDSTEYHIDDASYDAAKEAGKNSAADRVGYDGSGSSTLSTAGSVIGAGGAAFGALAPKVLGEGVGKILGAKAVEKLSLSTTLNAGDGGIHTKLGNIATVILASAVAAKYWASNHNKDEHEAAMKLMQEELPDAQGTLYETQNTMEDAAEEVLELTEEAEEKNEEANEKIKEDKTLFDFQRQQYDALKTKKDSGEQLTPDEQALMKQLAPQMQELGNDITTTQEDTSDEVNDLYDTIGEYQDVYDDSAESIAEVEGVTDYAEGFDEGARTTMYVEGVAQGVNAASALAAAAKLSVSGFWNWAFAAMGYAAGASSGIATSQQISWAKDMTEEIHMRRDVQDIGLETNDLYEENLDNYADHVETFEKLELEDPEDMEIPTDTAPNSSQSMMSMASEQSQGQNNGQPAQLQNKAQSTSDNKINESDPNKKKEEEK